MLDEESDDFTFQVFNDNKKTNTAYYKHGTLEDLAPKFTADNGRGCGVFFMVNEGDGRGRNHAVVKRIRAAFVDLDGPALEPIMGGPLEPHIVTNSSPGHWQVFWLVDGLEKDEFYSVQDALRKRFDGDPNIVGPSDACRVMRLPGFYHMKTEPHLVTIHHENPVRPYERGHFLSAFGIDVSGSVAPLIEIPVEHSARVGVSEGFRDIVLFKYACSLRAKNLAIEEIRSLVRAAAARCKPPFPQTSADAKIDSAFKYTTDLPHNDIGNAQRLVRLDGDRLQFCHPFNQWFVFDGAAWRKDQAGQIIQIAKGVVETIGAEAVNERDDARRKPLKKHAHASGSRNRIDAMVQLAKSESGIPVAPDALDADPMLLGTQSCIIDLRTLKARPASSCELITNLAGTDYNDEANCDCWLAFLQTALHGKQEMIAYVQRAVGYTLTALTTEQVLFFLYGSGANGKTTFVKVIQALLGDYAKQTPTETLMARHNNGSTNDLARLRGARLAVATETEDGKRFSESLLKQLTGGDKITARFLYAEHFEFIPVFKLWLCGNHKPTIRGDDLGIWRRFHLVPFTATIPEAERDPKLLGKLLSELPGILNWALTGCREWQEVGLNPPNTVLSATKEYRNEMDVLSHWIEECCEVGDSNSSPARELYNSYQEWARRAGEFVMSKTQFGRKLTERFDKDAGRFVVYRGVSVDVRSDGKNPLNDRG